MFRPLAGVVALAVAIGGCSVGQPQIDFTVENVSDEAFEVVGIDAPELAYRPIAGFMDGHGQSSARSSGAVRSAPSQVLVAIKGRPRETVAVPPLPPDLEGRIALVVVYARSRRWVAHWQLTHKTLEGRPTPRDRLIPDEDDPQFRLHEALVEAADAGDVQAVDALLQKGAPVRWDTTWSNPLISAARWERTAVVERLLLQPGGATFTPFEIEDAIVAASDADHTDIGALRLLMSRYGAALRPEARARMLSKARETNLLREGRTVPAGPAIRFLIDEAKFDVNTPIWESGETLWDLVSGENPNFRDDQLLEFLNARGGRSGKKKK
jgi:hypothetical protein